jgi:hypothetical protein
MMKNPVHPGEILQLRPISASRSSRSCSVVILIVDQFGIRFDEPECDPPVSVHTDRVLPGQVPPSESEIKNAD